MKCRNCDRVVTATRSRCPACQTKMPMWYLIAIVLIGAGIFAGFKIVEKIL
jgi:RNA polymerase subunit RPABC4/transcription elongation factor Spt4